MASTDVESTPESRPAPAASDEQATEPPPETAGPAPDDLPLDEVFGLLKNQRRRRVLGIVQQRDEMVTIGELAEEIAALENDKPVAQLHSEERKRVYVGLHQVHLPKMDALNVVEFNKPRGTIEPSRNTDTLLAYIERAEADDPGEASPWHRYYLALSVVAGVAIAVAMWLDPLTTLPLGLVVAVSVVVGFSILAIANYLLESPAG